MCVSRSLTLPDSFAYALACRKGSPLRDISLAIPLPITSCTEHSSRGFVAVYLRNDYNDTVKF